MRKIFALIVIVLCLVNPAFCAQREIKHDWVWNVLVIPPANGWDSEPGKSINTALKWCEAEISDSGSGVGGHDLKFIRLNLNTSSDNPARDLNFPIDDHTAAIMSFVLSPEIDRVLVARLAGRIFLRVIYFVITGAMLSRSMLRESITARKESHWPLADLQSIRNGKQKFVIQCSIMPDLCLCLTGRTRLFMIHLLWWPKK